MNDWTCEGITISVGDIYLGDGRHHLVALREDSNGHVRADLLDSDRCLRCWYARDVVALIKTGYWQQT